MSKVNAYYPSALKIHHEVGEMAIPNAQYVLAAGDGGYCANKVGTESEEGLRRGSQLHECSPIEGRESQSIYLEENSQSIVSVPKAAINTGLTFGSVHLLHCKLPTATMAV